VAVKKRSIDNVKDAKWIAKMMRDTVENDEGLRFTMQLIGENVMYRAIVKDLRMKLAKKENKKP